MVLQEKLLAIQFHKDRAFRANLYLNLFFFDYLIITSFMGKNSERYAAH